MLPVEILKEAVESYAPYLQASGEMYDPVFGVQYWRERRWLGVPALEPSWAPQQELGHA